MSEKIKEGDIVFATEEAYEFNEDAADVVKVVLGPYGPYASGRFCGVDQRTGEHFCTLETKHYYVKSEDSFEDD